MNDVVAVQPGSVPATQLTATQLKAQINLVQQVMAAVMKPNTHYGIIPGTQKPTLYKAGAEVLLTTFRIAVYPEVTDLSTTDEIRYRVQALGRHQASGTVVGVGIGECGTGEEKYKWRDAVCAEEWEDTPEDRRRTKYCRGKGGGHYKRQQVRTQPADLANTVLKMAKKRAQTDLCLTATSASDIFTQDLEDDDDVEGATTAAPVESPAANEPRPEPPMPEGPCSPGQVRLLERKIGDAGVDLADFLGAFKVATVEALPFARVNDALAWIKRKAGE